MRAGLWRQHHGITYLVGIFDSRNNAYPPGGEVVASVTMVLAHNERFVALDEFLSALALAVAAVGIARRVGLPRRQALFGGLVVATLPVIILQAGTALTDLVEAAFLVCAAFFGIDSNRWSPWLAGIALGLAVDVKLTTPVALPALAVLALVAPPTRLRLRRYVAGILGLALGSFWYIINLVEHRHWHGGIAYPVDRSAAASIARSTRLAIDLIDVPGAVGRDRWLYAIAAFVVLAVSLLALARRRVTAKYAAIATALALTPLLLFPVHEALVRVFFKVWRFVGHKHLAGLASGHDITRSLGRRSSADGNFLGTQACSFGSRAEREDFVGRHAKHHGSGRVP